MIEPLHTVAVKPVMHTVEMLAELLHEPSTVQVLVWRRQRNWPGAKFGHRWLWTPEQVCQILALHQAAAPPTLAAVPHVARGRNGRRT